VTTSGTQAYAGLVTLAANTTLAGTTPTFTAGVAGGGKNLTLNFSGTTVIVGAVFTGLAAITTDAAGSTTLSGSLTTSGTQTFNDAVTLAADTTLDAGTASIVLAGVVSGGFSLTPLTSGAGTTTLSGANTNTTTNVTRGVVILANTTPQTSTFLVSGGSLRGTGTIGTLTVTGTGSVAPGTSPGTIGTSSLSLAAGTTLQMQIAGNTAGSGYDQLVVGSGGAVDLTNATLALSATAALPADTVLTIVDNQGSAAVTGTFAGLPEGTTVTVDTQEYRISYVGGSGNDVTLTALQTDDVIVSVDANKIMLSLSPTGVAISSLQTAYNARTNVLTITATQPGTMVASGGGTPGVTVNSAAKTIAVNLGVLTGFAGISVVGNGGADSITIGGTGINLAAVTKGAASQSFSIDTMAGATDMVVIGKPILAKGSGSVSIATLATDGSRGIRFGAGVTTVSGSQTYSGPATLVANTALTAGAGAAIGFSGTLNGAKSLALSAGGAITFAAAVGGTTPLQGVSLSRAGSVAVNHAFHLDGSGTAKNANGLTIGRGVNNVVFSTLGSGARTIQNFSGSGISFAGGSVGSTITGIVSRGNGAGLSFGAGSYAGTRVQDNTFDANLRQGVSLDNATGLLLGGTAANAGNRIINSTAWKAYSTGIQASGNSAGTLVQGNMISGNTGNGVILVAARGITIGGSSPNAGNTIQNNGGFGLLATGVSTGSLVQGNTITGNRMGAVNTKAAKGLRVV
jgi:hypothetical protein